MHAVTRYDDRRCAARTPAGKNFLDRPAQVVSTGAILATYRIAKR
jgi:hypothetical protein